MAHYRVEDVVSFGNGPTGLQIGDELEFKQLFNWKELFGWEAKNKYMATSYPNGKQLFVAETGPPDCHRCCCKANREWNLSVYDGPDDNAPKVLKMRKPQECCFECCGHEPTPCFHDRELTVMTTEDDEIAKASHGCCVCCHYNIHVDVLDEHRYDINGSLCQLGACCPCLADAEFEIVTADGKPTTGSVTRPQLTCAECIGKTNRIVMRFPEEADQADKVALMGGAIMFDILEEIRDQQEDNDGGGGD